MHNALALNYQLLLGHPFSSLSAPVINKRIDVVDCSGLEEQAIKVTKAEGKILSSISGRLVLAIDVISAYGKKVITVMTVPLKLRVVNKDDSVFSFYPDTSFLPLLNQDLFEHDGQVPAHHIGSAHNISRFDSNKYDLLTDNWSTWMSMATDMFDKICDVPLMSLCGHPGLCLNEPTLSMSIRTVASDEAQKRIIQLYEDILSEKGEVLKHTSLKNIERVYTNTAHGKPLMENFLPKLLNKIKKPSLAHMDECNGPDTGDYTHRELFALDNTQRGVVNIMQYLNEGDVLAVNGPPGSGKTAMLKAVISHEFVKAAIDGSTCPIVIGVGGTNQSVTNIVNAFPNVLYKGDARALHHMRRWIPGPDNYGTFFPSDSALKEMSEKLRAATVIGEIDERNKGGIVRWIGQNAKLNTPSAIDEIESIYKRNSRLFLAAFFDGELSLEKATELLKQILTSKEGMVNELKAQLVETFDKVNNGNKDFAPRISTQFRSYFDTEKYNPMGGELIELLFELCTGDLERTLEIISDVCREYIADNLDNDKEKVQANLPLLIQDAKIILADRAVDLLLRADMFHLAARYWEGRYIIECKSSLLLYPSAHNLETALRRMCMITPVLVCTVQSAPKLFAYSKPKGMSVQPHLFGAADLLIIDEAGQADIRTTLPLLALAKKTVAVGDVEQIPPVIKGVTSLDEQFLYDSLQIGKDPQHTRALHRYAHSQTLLPSLNGSILHVLRHISKYNYQGKGMTLRGHYRCQATLSQFCNELVYDNKIFIIKPLYKEKGPIKPLTWVPSQHKTLKIGTSHISRDEAKQMVSWLIQNWKSFYDHYNDGKSSEKRLSDIVGIISPYKEQSLVFSGDQNKGTKGYLHQRLIGIFEGKYAITAEDIDKMKVGTVNALQGAEKPIILFSGVKSMLHGGDIHYRKETYILNVAVSRAKECFVAFICPETFGIQNKANGLTPPTEPKNDSVGYLGYYLSKEGSRLYPRKIAVIESPNKEKALRQYLGSEYVVISTLGKVLSLELDEAFVSICDGLRPQYQYAKTKTVSGDDGGTRARTAVANIISVCNDPDIDEIILATDDDYVGEHIAWHMYKLFMQHQPSLVKKIKRVRLRGITQKAVDEAFGNPTQIDFTKASAETVREVVDILIARKLSKIALQVYPSTLDVTKQAITQNLVKQVKYKAVQGCGRVSSALLSLLKHHLDSQVESIVSPHKTKVTVKVNGKHIHGYLVDKSAIKDGVSEDSFVSKLKGKGVTEGRPDKWYLVQADLDEEEYASPYASTLNIMYYCMMLHDMSPQQTYDALTSLYEGNY
jgi:hypothetical protein